METRGSYVLSCFRLITQILHLSLYIVTYEINASQPWDSAMTGQQNDKVEWNCQLKFVFIFFLSFFFLITNPLCLNKIDFFVLWLNSSVTKMKKKNDEKDIPCLGLLYKITDFVRNHQKRGRWTWNTKGVFTWYRYEFHSGTSSSRFLLIALYLFTWYRWKISYQYNSYRYEILHVNTP